MKLLQCSDYFYIVVENEINDGPFEEISFSSRYGENNYHGLTDLSLFKWLFEQDIYLPNFDLFIEFDPGKYEQYYLSIDTILENSSLKNKSCFVMQLI